MNQQENKTVDYLISEENDERGVFQFDDLDLNDEQLGKIKGGPIVLEDCLISGYQNSGHGGNHSSNHSSGNSVLNSNEMLVADDDAAAENELDDLLLTAVQENDIKAGPSDGRSYVTGYFAMDLDGVK